MLYIIDEKGKGHGALAEFGVTHGVNGEKSITGTIYTNEEVIHGIDRGWKLRFDGETYAFIYAKPVDLGDVVQVEFDAVHSFFYDFSKSTKDEQLKDGSHTMQAYLDFIFKDSGYSFRLDTQVNAFEKQGFGYKNRLALFNDVISSAGVEFSVNGSVVRIIDRVGNDLSTVVRKGFNLNDLTIEKNIGDFVTAQKGFGAWKDAEDHSKGRLEVEYISPLEDIYGRLDADPVVDERYTNSNSLKARLENNVEGSYSISVALDMADLTKAGYEYKQPQEGDYIMAINEDLGFKRKIRIVSYTSKYDTSGELIDHNITANSLGMVHEAISGQAKTQNSINELRDEIAQTRREVTEVRVSADGKTNNYWSSKAPNPQEYKLNIGDTWYDTSREDVVIYGWNGVEWRRVSFDKTAFERQFAEIEKKTQDMTISIAEADTKAKSALDKVGVADNLLGEHQKMIASLNGQLAEDLVTDQTVTNPKTWLTNYGKLVANNGYDTTDYIPVNKDDLLSLESTVSHYYKLAFYDTGKNNLGYYDGSKVVLTPSGTAYFGNTGTLNAPADGFIRLSYSTATGGADTVKLSNQSNLYTLINSGYNNALSALRNVDRAMQEFGENLISLDSLNRGYWLNAQGKLMENAPYKTTDYIRVDSGERYKLTGGNAVYQVYFYDANRDAIAYYDGKSIKEDVGTGYKYFTATPNVELIMPSNASYVRIASSIKDFEQVSFSKLSTIIANMFDAVDGMKQSVENDLSGVRDKANEAFDKAIDNGGKLSTVEQSVDDLKGEISQKVTSADVSTALNTFNETVKTQTASQITESLTGYAKSTDLEGYATEEYATNKAVSEAGKVSTELTKYELKTGVDSKVSSLAASLREETAEKMKTVYTKEETEELLGDKADSSVLTKYVQQATYEAGIEGISSKLSEMSSKKLDFIAFEDFFDNEYKRTAQGVTDMYTKVNKIIDANGTATDTFAKAVYDRNAERQNNDFQAVTNDLVKTATYEEGINGVKQSITSVEGKIDNLSVGGRNLIDYSMITSNSGNLDKSNYVKKGLITFSITGIYSGVRIDASKLEPNTEYVMSYKYQKTSGTLVSFGGHTTKVYENNLAYVDGSTKGSLYYGNKSVFVKDDNEIHSVVVKFTTPSTITPSGPIYIQPNRGYDTKVSVNIYDWKLEKGSVPTDWSPAPEDMLGEADFQIFKNNYESNDKSIKSRLTAIDSGKEGSLAYRLNETESTAKGNSTLISTIKNNYVTQKDINESILADKQIIDTRTTNELPPYYYNKYPRREVREFKLVSVMGIGSGGFGILTTNVPWNDSSGGKVQQTFDTETEKFTRQGSSTWSEWVKQIDTADTTYQKITETSSLYERVIGSSSGEINNNISRIVQTSNVIQMEVAKMDLASGSDLSSVQTQLANSWGVKIKSAREAVTSINANVSGVQIKGELLNLDAKTTVAQEFWAKQVNAIKVNADNITTGTLDGSRIRANSIDTNRLTGNISEFIRTNWNSVSGTVSITGADGILTTAGDGSQTYIKDGIVGTRQPSSAGGGTVGQIGYAYESASPWYSMQVSNGSHFQIRMSRGDGQLNKKAFYIISGGTESYLNTDNIYLNPASNGRVRVQGAMTVDKNIRAEGAVLVRQKLEYLNGGFIESQSANSNMLIASSNKLIIYTNGSNALEFDANNAVFRRKISENSDIRLKTNIVDMPINSLEAIRNIEIKKFDYLDGRKNYYGIIAQQAQQYLPELINTDSEGHLMVDKSAMTYVNMHAIQQLDKKVNTKVIELEQKIASLQEELALLKGD